MIFLSIYIFTFILNWYTFDSLVVENFVNNEKNKEKKLEKQKLSKYHFTIQLLFI